MNWRSCLQRKNSLLQWAPWKHKTKCHLPFLQRQELPPNSLWMAAGLAQPQQGAQDGVHGAAVEAAEFQAPVWDLPEFDQSVLRADLMLTVVEVTLDGGEVQPVHLLRLRRNLDLGKEQQRKKTSSFSCHSLVDKVSVKRLMTDRETLYFNNPTWSITSFLADRHNSWAITLYRGSVFPRR